MNADLLAIARSCLDGAHADSMTFPQIIQNLGEAGFDGYHVDFRTNQQSFYHSNGDTAAIVLPGLSGPIGSAFDGAQVAEQVRLAQAEGPDYTYDGFCRNVREAGCAGYMASIPGRRVLYYGRTAEIHVEHFPQ